MRWCKFGEANGAAENEANLRAMRYRAAFAESNSTGFASQMNAETRIGAD